MSGCFGRIFIISGLLRVCLLSVQTNCDYLADKKNKFLEPMLVAKGIDKIEIFKNDFSGMLAHNNQI